MNRREREVGSYPENSNNNNNNNNNSNSVIYPRQHLWH